MISEENVNRLAQEFYEASGIVLPKMTDKSKIAAGLEAILPRVTEILLENFFPTTKDRSEGYTPSATELVGLWIDHRTSKFRVSQGEAFLEFERWLNLVKEIAWDRAIGEASEQGTIQIPDNPYRSGEGDR